MYSSYEELIKAYALQHEDVVVMTAENRALIRSLPAVLGDRFIDTGITEQAMVGAAAGLALRGRKPILHALASFLTMRAFEFVRTDIGIAKLPVKLTSFVPGFLSDGNGPTHQAIEDISLMRGIPGMEVYAPADNEDMLLMLETIWNNASPAYIRANTRPAVYKHAPFVPGKAEIVSRGTDVTLLVYGMLFEQALKTKELLETQGLSVGLANLRSLQPIDREYVLDMAQNGGLLVTIEDHFLTGGLYSILAEIFTAEKVTADILPIALKNKWYKPGLLSELLTYEGFTGQQIAARVLDHLGRSYDKTEVLSGIHVHENVFDE